MKKPRELKNPTIITVSDAKGKSLGFIPELGTGLKYATEANARRFEKANAEQVAEMYNTGAKREKSGLVYVPQEVML